MADKVEVDAAYLRALQRFIKAYDDGGGGMGLNIARDRIRETPQPAALNRIKGWPWVVVSRDFAGGYYLHWSRGDDAEKRAALYGPSRPTREEAIEAGNALLKELRLEVEP